MKKIYSLLLLSGLMLLGAQNTWADDFIKGDFNLDGNWVSHKLAYDGVTGTVDIFLPSDKTISFGFQQWEGSTEHWWGGKDVTSSSCSNLQLAESSGNNSIKTTIAGYYTFTIVWSTKPYLTITYPTGSSYTVAFTNPNNWENVYAYVWFYDSADRKAFGGYPGKKLTAPYTVTVEAETAPSWIIWSNGTTEAKTGDLDFVANQVYNMTGEVSVPITPDGYATFYAPCKVQVPSGVTAYTGAYNAVASTLTLNELTGNSDIIANTPVVLKRTSGSGNITFTAVTEDAGSVSGTNNLHGTAAEITTPANSYVLGYQESTTAFYHFTGANIAANKAYLVIDGGAAQAAGIRIIEGENGATSIDAIEASEKAVKFVENGKLLIKKNGVVYDTTGRVVR